MRNKIATMLSSLHCMLFLVSGAESLQETESHTELDLCKSDAKIESVCNACSKLPYGMAMSVMSCCQDYQVLEICDTCTSNPTACLKDIIDLETNIIKQKMNQEIVSSEDMNSENSDDSDTTNVNKRYGRVFFGRRPVLYSNYLDKRFGRLFLGSRPLRQELRSFKQKRWGKLFMNKKSVDMKDETSQPDKRFGRLFMTPYLDKRYGAFRIGKPSSGRYFWK